MTQTDKTPETLHNRITVFVFEILSEITFENPYTDYIVKMYGDRYSCLPDVDLAADSIRKKILRELYEIRQKQNR